VHQRRLNRPFRLAAAAGLLALAGAVASLVAAQQAPPGDALSSAPESAAVPEDPTRTAGGALAAFMGLRHYLTIRELKAVMTADLQARFDHDSAPFNGKRGGRIAAYDFSERDLKPAAQVVRSAVGARPPETSAAAPTGGGPAAYLASMRSLWEEQGEATELRVETARLVRQEDGLWRVASLDRLRTDPLRFREAVSGVTALRLLLRAWTRGDLRAARSNMSPAFIKKFNGRDQALRDLLVGGPDPRHAAYQILEMKPEGPAASVARIKLFESNAHRPTPLDGSVHTLRMVKKGAPWLLDAWD
jgi:hypothetical protein